MMARKTHHCVLAGSVCPYSTKVCTLKHASSHNSVNDGAVVKLVVNVLQEIVCAEWGCCWVEFNHHIAHISYHANLGVRYIKASRFNDSAIGQFNHHSDGAQPNRIDCATNGLGRTSSSSNKCQAFAVLN